MESVMVNVHYVMSIIGGAMLIGLCWLCSSDRKRINWRLVGWAIGLQVGLALFMLKGPGKILFGLLNKGCLLITNACTKAAGFLFGNLVYPNMPVGESLTPNSPGIYAKIATEGAQYWVQVGATMAFAVMTSVIGFNALLKVLYHFNIMQKIVKGMSWVMEKTLQTSGAESLAAAANVFVGQSVAPLVIKPYINRLTRSEIMAVMTGGMATITGAVMVAFVMILKTHIPDIGGHLLVASVLSAPAALMFAKLLIPETETPQEEVELAQGDQTTNVLDAIDQGSQEGGQVALNISFSMIGMLTVIYTFSYILQNIHPVLALPKCAGYLFVPFAILMGIPYGDWLATGMLLADRIIFTEVVAYRHFALFLSGAAPIQEFGGHNFSEATKIILPYAMCGFASLSSLAILIRALKVLAPERKDDIVSLAPRSLVAGVLASFLTANIVGLLNLFL